MAVRVVCPVCGRSNAAVRVTCKGCRTPLRAPPAEAGLSDPAAARPGGVLPSNRAAFEPAAAERPRSGALWRRGLAFLVFDELQITLMVLVLAVLLRRPAAVLDLWLPGAWEPVVQIVVAWLHWTSREASEARATYGKQFAGLVVTDLGGGRLSYLQALKRNFVKQGFGLVLVLGLPALGVDWQTAVLVAGAFVWAECLLALCNPRRRALHDVVAGSVVVRREPAPQEP